MLIRWCCGQTRHYILYFLQRSTLFYAVIILFITYLTFTILFETPDILPDFKVREVSCSALIAGDRNELKKAYKLDALYPKIILPDKYFTAYAQDCELFRNERRYIMTPLSKEEADFPLAFSILMYKDVEQVERLLRAIYHPQNYYCIHIDASSKTEVHEAVHAIANCFHNVFVASRQINVHWGSYSIVAAELACMKDLLKYKGWKYFINLTGQEFPLKTNLDLVRILTEFKGANNIRGTVRRRKLRRLRGKAPPFGMLITKGEMHIAASWAFINFTINDPIAKEFNRFVQGTAIPDETFFSTLNYNPQLNIPGSYKGRPETNYKRNLYVVRFKNWGTLPCKGKYKHGICVFSVADLPLLASRFELFANKFYIDYQQYGYKCMEELHYQRIYNQIHGVDDGHINISFYKGLDFAVNHVIGNETNLQVNMDVDEEELEYTTQVREFRDGDLEVQSNL